jgi:hypothetical protein
VIHAGATVEWTNDDPSMPHTITFGTEPTNPIPPSGNVSVDADGALHATISSTSDSVNSGFIVSAPQDEIGLPQTPLAPTRFRITFIRLEFFRISVRCTTTWEWWGELSCCRETGVVRSGCEG